jgi:hypothetical protein
MIFEPQTPQHRTHPYKLENIRMLRKALRNAGNLCLLVLTWVAGDISAEKSQTKRLNQRLRR